MAKRKTYSRQEAITWMELGHKAKPAKWLHGEWIRLNKDGDFVDEDGVTFDSREVRQELSRDGWLLLGKARMDREARIAELEAEAEKLVEQRNDAMRKHDALADQLRELTSKFAEETEERNAALVEQKSRVEGWIHTCGVAKDERDKAQSEAARLRKELEAAQAAAPRFQVGDVVQRNPNGERMIVERVNLVSVERGAGMRFTYPQDELQPATDLQPESEWHPCSAAEAREHHATGLRVRVRGCRGWLCRGSEYDREGGQSNPNYGALRNLALAGLNDEWEWAEPLPEGGVS